MENERNQILNALQSFIRQKPGMEPGNYDPKGYRNERAQVLRDLHHAETLLAAVRWRTGIDAGKLKEAFPRAFSGRLTWIPAGEQFDHHSGGAHTSTSPYGRLEYCTGQYFPTEYRKAVCAVLASALWEYWRDGLKAIPVAGTEGAKVYGPELLSAGAYIRKSARKEFGVTIAKRYFDYRAEDYR